MESSTEPAAPARTFSQVVFTDIPHSYPPSTHVTCSYTLTADLQPTSRDWVGIFKVGWSSTKDYHTFVWVESCQDAAGQSVTSQAAFKDYYLPKDEVEFYQFCYVDSSGQVRGASTPFCFRNPAEQSMESSPDDDLLVITTQEQVELSVREKAELQKQLNQIMEEKETLKQVLQQEQQEAAGLKEQNEQKEREIFKLVKELGQTKEQSENLKSALEQQLKEKDHLKEEMLTQMTKQMEMQQRDTAEQEKQCLASRHKEEKYDRALMKIKQLKEEREELRGGVEAQSAEISMLKSKVREDEREMFNIQDGIQLLQVDLQSSEKENARLSAELQQLKSLAHSVDDVKRENQELCRRLSQQETPHTSPDDDLKVRCQTLAGQLQDTQAKLAAEKKESKNARRRAEHVEGELLQVKQQLETLVSTFEQEQRKNNKLELQLRELHELIADKDGTIEEKDHVITLTRHEKDELLRENQNLVSDIEGLRTLYAEYHAAPPAGMNPSHPQQQQEETPEQAEHLYETIGSAADPEEEALVCRHCQEIFPFITREELEQHEQSHKVCPFCTMICDNMEQSVYEDHVYGHEL
ncbi:calcium-binding and coiled-coil domain-containing protein 2 isoform X2 [Pempheris klunzingeri]|uniref:calcium-binding and coiled-coil domain-containing protein 2 isoform X2 n=1 Tax=Pempheris klunzingeri TaxID=3127111 RepID=UPI003980C0A3